MNEIRLIASDMDGTLLTSDKKMPEDFARVLHALREKGVRVAIGSSSKNTPFILGRIGLGDFFEAVADGNCITHSKPHPEVFLKAAAMLGLEPADCLVVEDARAGVEAAVSGGFDCASIGDAYDDPRARWHLKSFGELNGIA